MTIDKPEIGDVDWGGVLNTALDILSDKETIEGSQTKATQAYVSATEYTDQAVSDLLLQPGVKGDTGDPGPKGDTGDQGPAGTVNDTSVAAVVPGATATGAAIDTRIDTRVTAAVDTLNVKNYGVTGDGSTDDTTAINVALAAIDATKNRTTVVFPPGTYMVNGVNLTKADGASRGIDAGIRPLANTTIILQAGATIKVIANSSQGYAAIYLGPDVDNVTIKGPGQIVGDRDTHDYTTAGTHEWGYGVYGRGAQNMIVDGVSISKMTGDCILAGSVGSVDDTDPTYNPSSGQIINCYLDGARRNNISLIATDHFLIDNNTISRAGYNDGIHDGTAPRAGIDLEFSSTQAVKNTDIRNNRFVGNITASVEAFNSSGLHVESNFMDSGLIVGAHVLNNCTIRGNWVVNLADTTSNGIGLSTGSVGVNNVLVADNIVMGFNIGITLTGGGVTCSGNYVTGFTLAGINTQLATDISVIGNHVADPAAAAATPAGILSSTPATSPRVEVLDNRISGCYYGMNWRQSATGVTAKGNVISKSFIGFNVGTNCAAIIEGNVTDLPGHTSGQSSDVITTSTSKTSVIGNTFRNSTAPSVAAISGGSGGISRIIGNKIVNTTATSGITCVGGTHEVTGNILSSAATSGTNYAIQITGAAVSCLVIGNTAYHTSTTAWSRLVKSDAATGTPATLIMGNTFNGAIIATANSSDTVGENFSTTRIVSKRVSSTASTATLTPDIVNFDAYKLTAQAAALSIAAPTGTPASMQSLVIRIKDNGTARAITWNAAYRAVGVTLPTTTVISKVLYVGLVWNSDNSTWDAIAVAQEA